MFNKKYCSKCGSKINPKENFCPNCGNRIQENSKEDWGMLGKDDNVSEQNFVSNSIFGGIGGKVISQMLGSAMKMLEKEMNQEIKNQTIQPIANMKLMINGREINLNKVKAPEKKPIKKIKEIDLPKNNLKKFSNLEKQEPLTNIRRLSDKVIYEIEMPEVESIKDISIAKLENNLEVKAVAKNNSYFKLIPIKLPITNYKFLDGLLILEFDVKN